eukprot:938479-Rhodomonas_salina.2
MSCKGMSNRGCDEAGRIASWCEDAGSRQRNSFWGIQHRKERAGLSRTKGIHHQNERGGSRDGGARSRTKGINQNKGY